jgi:hypothetical protein
MSSWDVSRLTVELGMHVLKPSSDAQVSKKVRRVTRHKGFDSRTLVSSQNILESSWNWMANYISFTFHIV